VKIRYTDSARLKAIISTPLMIRFPERKNPYSEMPKGLSAQFYNDQGEPNSRLSANYGINFEQQKLIQLRDSVRVYNTMGEELKSEELYWDQVRKKIYTNTYVVIKRAGDTIRGDGFESNENFTKYRITKPHGRVKLKENIEGDETP
jgi:LPS export ABC transporter protein LptC